MALFVIERNFAEQIAITKEFVDEIQVIHADEGVEWLFTFLSADKRKSYCIFEAPNAEGIIAAAQRAGLPADVVTPVDEFRPEAFV